MDKQTIYRDAIFQTHVMYDANIRSGKADVQSHTVPKRDPNMNHSFTSHLRDTSKPLRGDSAKYVRHSAPLLCSQPLPSNVTVTAECCSLPFAVRKDMLPNILPNGDQGHFALPLTGPYRLYNTDTNT